MIKQDSNQFEDLGHSGGSEGGSSVAPRGGGHQSGEGGAAPSSDHHAPTQLDMRRLNMFFDRTALSSTGIVKSNLDKAAAETAKAAISSAQQLSQQITAAPVRISSAAGGTVRKVAKGPTLLATLLSKLLPGIPRG